MTERVLGPETAKTVALMAAIIQAPSLALTTADRISAQEAVGLAMQIMMEIGRHVILPTGIALTD